MPLPAADKFTLVVAGTTPDGEVDFIDTDAPAPEAQIDIPGTAKGAWYWNIEGGHSRQNYGAVATNLKTAEPNGSKLGVMCFPAHSAGKLDISATLEDAATTGHDGDATIHATESIDYEIILSGKVDIELPGGKTRTLKPGDLLVMGGVPHAWKNIYDEDCLYISITIGFNK